jgi:hypothetical protein
MKESLLDAISAGIESASPALPDTEVNDDETSNLDGNATADAEIGGEVEGDEPSNGGDEESADGTESEQEEGAEKSGDKDGADADAKAAAAASKQAGDKADPSILKPRDPVNDPIPNALKKETKERMTSLIELVREKDTAVKVAITERDELLGMITETKSSPEQYGQALTYLGMVNSGDPVKMEQALTFMQQEVAVLAKMLGKPVAGVDMLSEHADLQQAVRDNLILQEHAEELAASRTRAKLATTQSQNQSQARQATDAQRAAMQQGREALNQIGAQLKADPDFDRKSKILIPALKPVLAKAPPALWGQIFQEAYKNLNLPKAAVPANVIGQQPLRGKNPSGGAAKAPGNLFEAISQGIESAGR